MTTIYARERTLQEEIAPTVEERLPGVEVLAVELLSPSRFCVYVDHPDGVDHALCESVTEALGGYLGDFTVEVSSPGPERPLRKREHFASAVGRRVAIRTGRELEGRKRFRGEVLAAGENAVTLAVSGAEPLDIRYDSIVRGNLIDEG
ncbi:MAG: ribosome maturation factor RimP [Actinobacteria bacterium]|nr:MAG: ribosome maturation factor RimP [Actinomycetota bacterium]TML44643.1 MAG: ribosome maturation factor RimP [Actinomycetota bacterium]TML72869.1 MAG: ribosome maturation factor RimP [Actinomycetota bacterium]